MPKRKSVQSAIDTLRENLQLFKPREAVGKVDKRSLKRSKRIVRDLGKQYTDNEIAQALEITRQKYTSIKSQIKKGKVSSSTLNDLLQSTQEKLKDTSGRPRDMRDTYISDTPVNGRKKFKIDFVEMGEAYIRKNMPWAQSVKPGGFASKKSALNWYGGVTGGKEYFSIVRGKNGRWMIYDTRTTGEKSKHRKGDVSGNTKAQRLFKRDGIKN